MQVIAIVGSGVLWGSHAVDVYVCALYMSVCDSQLTAISSKRCITWETMHLKGLDLC